MEPPLNEITLQWYPVGADFIERTANLLAPSAYRTTFANKLAVRSMKSAPTGLVGTFTFLD